MAVPSSGELKLWDTLWNNELGGSKGDNSLHSASVYADFDTPDALSDFYGWSDVEVPTVTTYTAVSVTSSTMCARVCVNTTGNEDPTYGVYFGTNSSSYSSNTKYSGGTGGVGLYNIYRTGLSSQTTYYWWGFACNSAGEAVGNRCSASTPAPPFSPSYAALHTANMSGGNFFFAGIHGAAQLYRNPYTQGHSYIRTKTCPGPSTSNYDASFSGQTVANNTLNRFVAETYGPGTGTRTAKIRIGQPSGRTFTSTGGHGFLQPNTSRCIGRCAETNAHQATAGVYYCF